MTLPQHIPDEPDSWKASQLWRNWFISQPSVDHWPSYMDTFAAGAEWQRRRDDAGQTKEST